MSIHGSLAVLWLCVHVQMCMVVFRGTTWLCTSKTTNNPPPQIRTSVTITTRTQGLFPCRHFELNGHDYGWVLSLKNSKMMFLLSNSTMVGISGRGTVRTLAYCLSGGLVPMFAMFGFIDRLMSKRTHPKCLRNHCRFRVPKKGDEIRNDCITLAVFQSREDSMWIHGPFHIGVRQHLYHLHHLWGGKAQKGRRSKQNGKEKNWQIRVYVTHKQYNTIFSLFYDNHPNSVPQD